MNMLHRALLMVVPVVLLMLFAGVSVALPPRITWTPSPLVMEGIAGGEQKTYAITFKNTGYLPIPLTNQLRIVPEGDIAKYVTVVPPKVPPVVKSGQSVTFDIAVTVPKDALIGASEGRLVLKRVLSNGKVMEVWRAEALPTSVDVVWPTFEHPTTLYSIIVPPIFYEEYYPEEDYLELKDISDSPQTSDSPTINVQVLYNPDGIDALEYFDGDPAHDFIGASLGSYATTTVGGILSYIFTPYQTISGEVIVVIPYLDHFIVVTDSGATHQADGLFQSILNSLRLGG